MVGLPDRYDIAWEAGLIRKEDGWPYWPVLPVKKVDGSSRAGLVIAGNLNRVVLMNLFELKSGPIAEQVKDKPTVNYESVEAMVADGWIGD